MSPALVTEAPPSEKKLSLYEASTQYRNWRYTTERLAHIRATLNEAAVAVIRTKIETDEVFFWLLHLSLIRHLNVFSSQDRLAMFPS